MKKIVLLSLLLVAFAFKADAKKVEIDERVTSVDGCIWHIHGWIDLGVVLGWPPVEVNGYDITIEGPCGEYRFIGAIQSNEGGGISIYGGHLYNLETGEPAELGSFEQLNFLLLYLESRYNTH